MGMTQIEMDVARSTLKKNNAIVKSIEEVDWEQRRYEIAKAMLPYVTDREKKLVEMRFMSRPQWVAVVAVGYADALIEELRRER